jgi:hypothetical protein
LSGRPLAPGRAAGAPVSLVVAPKIDAPRTQFGELTFANIDTAEVAMKPFTTVAVVVFSLVSLLQLLRLIMGWEVMINGISIPPWVSVIACLVAATLAFKLAREMRT